MKDSFYLYGGFTRPYDLKRDKSNYRMVIENTTLTPGSRTSMGEEAAVLLNHVMQNRGRSPGK